MKMIIFHVRLQPANKKLMCTKFHYENIQFYLPRNMCPAFNQLR